MNKIILLLTLASFYTSGFAQEAIETDRPDQTETTKTVPANRFQMENGFTHQQTGKDESEYLLPTSLWKFGISKNLEIRLITEIQHLSSQDSSSTGLLPVIAGFKVKLWDEKGLLPETSFIGHVLFPNIASEDLKVEYLAPEFKLLFQNTITDKLDLGYNMGMKWDGDSTHPIYEYTISPNVELSEKFKAYIEAFGYLPQALHPEHWFDGGLVYLLSKDIQLDISAGYEVTSKNGHHKFYESLGFSFRI